MGFSGPSGHIAPRKRYQILNNGGRQMPRAKQTMDGNTAAAHVAYAYTDVADLCTAFRKKVLLKGVLERWQSGRLRRS